MFEICINFNNLSVSRGFKRWFFFFLFRLDTTLGKPLHVLTRDKERTTVFSKLASMEHQMRDLDRKMDQILVLLHTQHQETRNQHQ